MPVKPIPYGIDDYKSIIENGYVYVDKTMYIRTLERAGVYHVFFRPRRFGKTLFASMLGYYYDIKEKDNFNALFSHLDIGKNPTEKKNAYYILKFNFSGIRTDSYEIMLEDFTAQTRDALLAFCAAYQLDIHLEKAGNPGTHLSHLFTQFQALCDGKIYGIIDEYDHFANELLNFNLPLFTDTVSGDGFIRKWYEVLKKASGTIVERIFITGVSPITLDSLTSGFNISQNLSMMKPFNEMMGFTRVEVEALIQETIPSDMLPLDLMDTLTNYYNGYLFNKNVEIRVFNSDMVLYYLNHFQQLCEPPDTLLDQNATSDYGKLEKLITFQTPEQNIEIVKKVLFDGYTSAELTERYTLGQEFQADHFKSLLFYLGLLTIKDTDLGVIRLQIPNTVIKTLYFRFLMGVVEKETKYIPDTDLITQAMRQLAYENSCEKFMALIEGLLHSFSNRDYIRFDEKYIKVAMAAYAGITKLYWIKSEYEVEDGYIDLVFLPRIDLPDLDILLFEIKYIKASKIPDLSASRHGGKAGKAIEDALSDAVEQLKRYSSAAEFQGKNITCWAVVFAGEKCVRRVAVEV